MDIKFGMWNVRTLYRAGSLKTVARKLVKYNLDPWAVQRVRWVGGGSQPAGSHTFSHKNGNSNHHLGTDFFIHKGIISAVRRVEFTGNRMLYVTLRG
jgi:hypothetical protein